MLVSEEKEFQIGRQVDKQVRDEMGIYLELPDLRSKVKEIAENIGRNSHRPDLIYRVEIVDTPDFNAFAVPGGFVYVHRGLLERMNSIDELASVVGHEIAHVSARHSASQISKAQLLNIGLIGVSIATEGAIDSYGNLIDLGSILAFSKFSRDDEREADYYGIQYTTEAGYNPKASIDVMKGIQSLSDSEPGALEIWFMTHPPTSERIELLNEELKNLESQDPNITKRKIQRNEFISLLEGMAVGEWNGKELIIGDRYYNKEYLLSIPVPEGWQVQINHDDYTAIIYDEKKISFAYFDVQPLRERKTSDTFFNELSRILSNQGLNKVSGPSDNKEYSHGAIAGIYEGNSGSSGPVVAQLIAFTKEGSGYYIFGITKKEEFEKLQPQFESMINDLRFMSSQESSKIDPPRMRIHSVSAGETWDSITGRYFKTTNEKKKLAEYNGLEIDEDPAPGLLLKIPPSLRFQ
jgi:predicted Zn-dependent protease